MTQALALRIAALVYLVLSTLFVIALIAGSALTEKIVTGGQQTSLAVFTTVAISLDPVRRAASIWPLAARMPSAICRSNRPESLGRSAGARLTVMRLLCGNSSP